MSRRRITAALDSFLYLWCLYLGSAVTAVPTAPSALQVDLDYGVYRGNRDPASGINVWKGIRYAAPPIGSLRWQEPQPPGTNRTVVSADTAGPQCPQSYPGGTPFPYTPGDEDCLFLDIYAPAGAAGLPVLVWIHGGGYGIGNGSQDLSTIINDNDKAFIGVSIQYRLGAFGFLSSSEVMDRGVVNAGLLDQKFALRWIQQNIEKFGGDPARVTISGESAGGGSVMLHSIAQKTASEPSLFQNGIAASPYLPAQWKFDDPVPTGLYQEFAQEAGCGNASDTFDCLVQADSASLQMASNSISQRQPYGEWAYLPVTDGIFLDDRPSVKLRNKQVNAARLLVGNNANEGPLFSHNPISPITNQDQLVAWLHEHLPNLSDLDVKAILAAYHNLHEQNVAPQETTGLNPPDANVVSQDAVGPQQEANNIYAESNFICPSYWLADAFTGPGKSAYHYQYSVPFAAHQADIAAYFGPATPNQSADFVRAFRRIWGNFVVSNDPSISNAEANGAASRDPGAPNPASRFPVWSERRPVQLNLNETGGVPYEDVTTWGSVVTQYADPGLVNAISSVDAYAWEGGRGERCKLWMSLAPKIMK